MVGRVRTQKGKMFVRRQLQSRLNIIIPTNELETLVEHGCRLGLCQCAPKKWRYRDRGAAPANDATYQDRAKQLASAREELTQTPVAGWPNVKDFSMTHMPGKVSMVFAQRKSDGRQK
jgi:hypothetical protein